MVNINSLQRNFLRRAESCPKTPQETNDMQMDRILFRATKALDCTKHPEYLKPILCEEVYIAIGIEKEKIREVYNIPTRQGNYD